MALREQTEARLVGFDQLGASLQVETLRAIEPTYGGPCLPTRRAALFALVRN